MSILLDVKQNSESDTGILLSFNRFNRKVGPNRALTGGFKLSWPNRSISESYVGLNSKGGHRTPLLSIGRDCWHGPVTSCERCRGASQICASLARSHTSRCVSMPKRSPSRCHAIQHPGSGKKPVSQVRRQLAAQRPGLRLLLIELQPG